MKEIVIELMQENPSDFYGGKNNQNISLIKKYFPKIKIVVRGNKVIALREDKLLKDFEKKFDTLLTYYGKFNSMDEDIVKQIFKSDNNDNFGLDPDDHKVILHGVGGKIIKARTLNQIKIFDSIQKNDMVFAIGPAGTGKTYTGVAMAVNALKSKKVKRIILTRPAVEAGENLGFLPGDLKDKLDPYMQPLYDSLRDMIKKEKLDNYIDRGIIQIAPMAFMRGRTLDDAFVILDEAQNTTHNQMKMFLTRMGKNAKFLINGDPGQIDLPRRVISGLKEAILVLSNVQGIDMIFLDHKDVIRHNLVKKVIQAYTQTEHNN